MRLLDTRMRRRVRESTGFFMNLFSAMTSPSQFIEGVKAARTNSSQMKKIAAQLNAKMGETPRVLHFVWGFSPKATDFPFFARMAIASALHYNPGSRAVIHFYNEPTGEHWDSIKDRVIQNPVKDFDFYSIARINHFAHKADIIRLQALNIIGGIYLDCDTLTAKSFEPLLSNKVVMAIQAGIYDFKPGLCNATMLSPKGAPFIRRWLGRYVTFRSRGIDRYWDYHSVKLPLILSYYHGSEISILPFDTFFYPLWQDIERVVFEENSEKWAPLLSRSFSFHLWNTFSFESLNKLDADFVERSTSVYAHFARPALKAVNA